MKRLLVYLKDYKKETVLAPLFKMLEASFELLIPLVMAAIIDKGIGTRNKEYIVQMCIVMVALGIIGFICSITAQFFAAKAAVGFSTKLRQTLFAHMQAFSFSKIDTIGTATMITRLTSDVNQVQSGVNLVLRLFLRSPFIVFGAMIMAFTVDVDGALVFAVTIPLLSVIVFGIMLINIPLYKKVQGSLDKVLGRTRENLAGVRVIRVFNRQEKEIADFHRENEGLTRSQIFVGRISAFMNPITYCMVNGAIGVLIWKGAWSVEGGLLTQGAVVALINYMSQILVELVKLANLIIIVTKSFASAKRIEEVFEMNMEGELNINFHYPDPHVDLGAQTGCTENKEYGSVVPAVEFDHVGQTYLNAGEESLSDLNFTVKKGETVGIIGGTGSGKTSLVNLIPGLYTATKGCVRINGMDVRSYPPEILKGKIGLVMQKAVLFKGTIASNLQWGKEDATEEEMWKALELAQAKEFVGQLEDGLHSKVLAGGKNFSGGQKQRLTIARALIRQPEILILDDSASALDLVTEAALREAIAGMSREMTVFIVSQRAASVQHADNIIVLEDGKAAGMGRHSDLLENCQVYAEIYASQFDA